MTDLQPFARDPVCPKCGIDDLHCQYMPEGSEFEGRPYVGRVLVPHKELERLSWCCRRCGWRWVSECAAVPQGPRVCAYCGKPTGMAIVWALGEACCGIICAHAVVSRYWAACAAGASLRPADDVAPDGPTEWALKAHAMRRAAKKVSASKHMGTDVYRCDVIRLLMADLECAVREYDAVCPDPESTS